LVLEIASVLKYKQQIFPKGDGCMKIQTLLFALLLFLCTTAFAQYTPPPRGKASIDKLASIDYGRPALKGRSIEAMFKMLPSDRVWRAGQNQVTIFTSDRDLLIEKKKISAGKYSVYVHISESGEWSLILNTDQGNDLVNIFPQAPAQVAHEKWPYYTNYTEKIAKQEVARVPMKSEKLAAPVDTFTIELLPNKDGGILKMSWGDRVASVDIVPAK
jgi:hypothetical protein